LDVTQELKNFNNDTLKDNKKKNIILRTVLTNAILANTPQSQRETGELKYKRYELATLVNCSDEPDISINDLKKLRDYVGEVHGATIVGVVWDILDNLDKGDSNG